MTAGSDNLVQLVIAGAEPVRPPPDDPPTEPKEEALGTEWPVTPLGVEGDLFYFLDALGQLTGIRSKDMSRLRINGLFGDRNELLQELWPRLGKFDKQTGQYRILGWDQSDAAEGLTRAAARKGVWHVVERVRGPGGWRGPDGELIWHCGDVIQVVKPIGAGRDGLAGGVASGAQTMAEYNPGQIGFYVYPAGPARPKPAEQPADTSCGHEVVSLFESWSWSRPDIDPVLLAGGVAAMMLGGALHWRPVLWVTGGRNTGKSTVHEIVKALLGDALIRAGDTTAAGIYQKTGHASLPVAVDELESDRDNRKQQALITLARNAATGALVLRGGAEHHGAEFRAQSVFLFSSILIPPLSPQDRSRMAILQLGKLRDKPAALPRSGALGVLGRQLRRRLTQGWCRFDETLQAYREMLAAAGHDVRGQDVFGTLLACHDLLVADALPCVETLELWSERLAAAVLREIEDQEEEEVRVLQHLLTSIADIYRGGARVTIGELVERTVAGGDGFESALGDLQTYGLTIKRANEVAVLREARVNPLAHYLCVATSHQGLAKLYQDTAWAGGVWTQALRRLEGARAGTAMRFRGVASKVTLVPVAALGERGDG